MKLLAVVAIGVITLIGAPTTGAAKSERLTKSCGAFLEDAEASWMIVQFLRKRVQEVGKQLSKPQRSAQSSDSDKFDEELARVAREQIQQVEIMADYAQIYSAFCK